MAQIDIFDEIERVKEEEALKTRNTMTARQWALYNAFKATAGRKLSDKELLEMLPDYGYQEEIAEQVNPQFNNLSSVRNLRKDKKAIRNNPDVDIILVNGKLANTTKEASKHLRKKKIKALKLLKEYWLEMGKLALDGQQKFTAEQEIKHIEAILKIEEDYEKGETK